MEAIVREMIESLLNWAKFAMVPSKFEQMRQWKADRTNRFSHIRKSVTENQKALEPSALGTLNTVNINSHIFLLNCDDCCSFPLPEMFDAHRK